MVEAGSAAVVVVVKPVQSLEPTAPVAAVAEPRLTQVPQPLLEDLLPLGTARSQSAGVATLPANLAPYHMSAPI